MAGPELEGAPDPSLVAALAATRAWLVGARDASGAWGYLEGSPPMLEPTVLAAAAGLPLPSAWAATQEPSFGTLLLPAVAWASAPELAARALTHVEQAAAEETAAAEGHDGTIPGWGWVSGTSAWVEPTAYAVLSLRRADKLDSPRCVDGLRLLRDRQCHDGGWNYGNPVTLGTPLEGQLAPTGWAVLALPPGDPAAPRGLDRLAAVHDEPSTLALALAALAYAEHGRDAGAILQALAARVAGGHARGRVDLTALAAAALAAHLEGRRVFW